MTGQEIHEWIDKVNNMNREEMCRLRRSAPIGHPCFVMGTAVAEAFEKRFREVGGFSPEISKKIGWDE